MIIPPAVISLDGGEVQAGRSSAVAAQQELFADDSDDSEWQQDWASGGEGADEEDDAVMVDLTQEDEVRILPHVLLVVIHVWDWCRGHTFKAP